MLMAVSTENKVSLVSIDMRTSGACESLTVEAEGVEEDWPGEVAAATGFFAGSGCADVCPAAACPEGACANAVDATKIAKIRMNLRNDGKWNDRPEPKEPPAALLDLLTKAQ